MNETSNETVVKAYDLKVLTSKLKGRGLDFAEEAAAIMVEELSDWIVESAAISPTPFDDIAAIVMPTLKKEIMKQVDKINGEVDLPESN